jgi:hypothetical protein
MPSNWILIELASEKITKKTLFALGTVLRPQLEVLTLLQENN